MNEAVTKGSEFVLTVPVEVAQPTIQVQKQYSGQLMTGSALFGKKKKRGSGRGSEYDPLELSEVFE